MDFIQRFIEGFHHAVIYDQRYLVYLDGLKVTTIIYKAFDDLGLRQQRFAGLVLSILILEDILAMTTHGRCW